MIFQHMFFCPTTVFPSRPCLASPVRRNKKNVRN